MVSCTSVSDSIPIRIHAQSDTPPPQKKKKKKRKKTSFDKHHVIGLSWSLDEIFRGLRGYIRRFWSTVTTVICEKNLIENLV